MSESPAFELRAVDASYGSVRALQAASLALRNGRTTAIVGVNGAGKSTALNIIAGLHPVDAGAVYRDGVACGNRGLATIRDGIGYSPEGRRVFSEMTIEDNLLVGAYRVRNRKRTADRLRAVFRQLPLLEERRGQAAGTLSGGQQQMLAIGRALMSEPRILLLDEPTLGLSPKMVLEIAELIRAIGREGMTIALVEQNASIALRIADDAYILEAGRVVMEGPSTDIRSDARVKETYLAAGKA